MSIYKYNCMDILTIENNKKLQYMLQHVCIFFSISCRYNKSFLKAHVSYVKRISTC